MREDKRRKVNIKKQHLLPHCYPPLPVLLLIWQELLECCHLWVGLMEGKENYCVVNKMVILNMTVLHFVLDSALAPVLLG